MEEHREGLSSFQGLDSGEQDFEPNTFIELFCGIGGFRLGLEASGWKCLWANDNDKMAARAYRKNFGRKEIVESDIQTVDTNNIPSHQLLCAGFPCQSFSFAGKRKGFADYRGSLFHNITRIAAAKKSPMLLLENVKGLLSAKAGISTGIYKATKGKGKGELTDDLQRIERESERGWEEVKAFVGNGYCFFVIIEALSKLGYSLEWQTLNSKYFGVPQNRERVFIKGSLGERSSKEIFPIGKSKEGLISNSKKNPGSEIAGALRRRDYKGGTNFIYWKNSKEKWVTETREETLTLKGQTDLCRQPLIIDAFNKEIREDQENAGALKAEGVSVSSVGTVLIHNVHGGFGERGRVFKDESPTLRTPKGGGHLPLVVADRTRTYAGKGRNLEAPKTLTNAISHMPKDNLILFLMNNLPKFEIRRLTPRECERLQGFPDDWTHPISDIHRYKLLGNAVTVNVIRFLGERLLG